MEKQETVKPIENRPNHPKNSCGTSKTVYKSCNYCREHGLGFFAKKKSEENKIK